MTWPLLLLIATLDTLVVAAGALKPSDSDDCAFAALSATDTFAVVKRNYRAIVAAGGVVLIGMGVLILTGEFKQLNIEASNWLSGMGLEL